MQTYSDYKKGLRRRQTAAKILATIVGISLCLFFFMLPLVVYRKAAGIPLDASPPGLEVWPLILGSGLGPGAGYAGVYLVLTKIGGFDGRQIRKMMYGRRR